MTRLLPLALFALFASGCTLENAGNAATSVKDGLTQVGEKVQSISTSEELKNASDSAKDALTSTGEIAIASTETAKAALTSVGETTIKVGEVAGSTLTSIGNTVIEAKASLTVPDPTPAPVQPIQPASTAVVVPAPTRASSN